MGYHVYIKPDGFPYVGTAKLAEWEAAEFIQYLGEFDEKPDETKKYVDGKWVWGSSEPEHIHKRRAAYPRVNAQLDALWHAMDEGLLPKVPGFYDRIAEVKKRFPKT